MAATAFVGQIIHCLEPYRLHVIENGYIIVGNEGKILSIGDASDLPVAEQKLNLTPNLINLTKTQLLLPGFVDTHIHAPQYPNAGLGYDRPLLEWLDEYTYKLERRYRDLDFSNKVYNAVVRKTLDCGTTTACYFGSLFRDSTVVLAQAVIDHGQRALVGKINMTRLAPSDYVETAQESLDNTLKFIEEVRALGSPLLLPVITPRFAPSVELDHLIQLGKIAQEQDLHIQTHISENKEEVELVWELFQKPYAQVYDAAGLLTPKTIMAHGVYLTDQELVLLKAKGTSISHCPESNVNLGSGNCDVARLRDNGITVGLGTDVAGGATPSIISAMRSAIATSANCSFTQENYKRLTYADVFYLATLGGAKALALDAQIGNFEPGKSFDAVIVDLDVESGGVDYLFESSKPEELLQKLIFVGDDRNVTKVFVNGAVVKS